MKTSGQRLYELKHPKFISVVLASERAFGNSFIVPNPQNHVPWHLLTKKCREDWERTAVGHNLVQR